MSGIMTNTVIIIVHFVNAIQEFSTGVPYGSNLAQQPSVLGVWSSAKFVGTETGQWSLFDPRVSVLGPGGTHMFRHTGMCHPNELLFHQKSLDMGPILVKKSLEEGPILVKKSF